jgi:hypothetical protein
VTFTPSSGTEQTITPISTDNDPSGEPIGASSMVLPQTSIEIGMLVSGPGIPSNTTVVYVESGANLYIELSKDIDDRGQELTFTNSGKSSFKLSDITVSGIPDSCTNKVFTIKLYDNESAEPLRISSGDIGDSSAQVWWANGYQSGDRDATDENEAVIACGGVIEQWPGRGVSWAFLNTKMGAKMVACHRLVKRYFDICPIKRVEATVKVNFVAGHRWVRMLGFKLETPIMKSYGPNGEDHSMYIRLSGDI